VGAQRIRPKFPGAEHVNCPEVRNFLVGVVVLALPIVRVAALGAQPPASAAPASSITLGPRLGRVTPLRQGFTHTGGGIIQVTQPTHDAVVVTMTGAAMAGAHPLWNSFASLQFDLVQAFDVSSVDRTAMVKLTLEARVLGLLRTHHTAAGSAEMTAASAFVCTERGEVLTVVTEPHSVAGREDLSINDHAGPVEVALPPGKYTLHQTFTISAAHARTLLPCGHASAEFAPDPALDPLWIGNRESFHGASKKELGFQITLRAATDSTGVAN